MQTIVQRISTESKLKIRFDYAGDQIRLYYISTMTMLIKTLFSAIETSDQGFNWTAEDYLIAFAMVSILICLIVYIRRTVKSQHTRAPLIIAAIIIILLIGIDLGVGVFNFPWSGD